MTELISFKEAMTNITKHFGSDDAAAVPGSDQKRSSRKKSRWSEYLDLDLNSTLGMEDIKAANADRIIKALINHLMECRYDFVMGKFRYQGADMDVMTIVNDRVAEFSVKTSLVQLVQEYRKVYWQGRQPLNKHSCLADGKALPNFFYFVCPAGMIRQGDIPAHAGLIHAAIGKKPDQISFTIVKAPQLLHRNKVTPYIYKHMVQRLYHRVQQLTRGTSE